MTANEKIKESEFFLQKIKDHYRTEEVDHYLSAFLSASRSIPYHLLQDYDQKFSFHISIKIKKFETQFRNKSKGNEIAENFLNLYDREISKINNDEIGHFMLMKRNITVHRSNDPFDTLVLESEINEDESKDVEIETMYFQVTPERLTEIVHCCQRFLELMKNMVSHMRKKFP